VSNQVTEAYLDASEYTTRGVLLSKTHLKYRDDVLVVWNSFQTTAGEP